MLSKQPYKARSPTIKESTVKFTASFIRGVHLGTSPFAVAVTLFPSAGEFCFFSFLFYISTEMAVTMKLMSLLVAALGALSFLFGVIAENKKPAAGTPITGKGVVICKYPADATVVLGFLSVAFLIASTVAGYFSLFYPYKGKSVPQSAMFRSTSFLIFFNIALFTGGLAAALLLWPTITEQLHLSRNVHHNMETACPTAKTGLLGGGAFVSLDSALFWLVALMLAANVREDYFDEVESKLAVDDSAAADYVEPSVLKGSA